MTEKKCTKFTLSLAVSADRRDPVELATARLAVGCWRRGAQHPAAAASHRPLRSAQPGVTTQGATSPSIHRQIHASGEDLFFFQISVNSAWKKSWSLAICPLGKDLNFTFSYMYRLTGHCWGKLNRLQSPRLGRSQHPLKSPGFRHLFSLEVMNRSTSRISSSQMNSKTGTGLESVVSKTSSVPRWKPRVMFHLVGAPQILPAAVAASRLGFLSPNFSLPKPGLHSEFEPLASPHSWWEPLLQTAIQNSKKLLRGISVAP